MYFSDPSKTLFPVQNSFSIEGREKGILLILKSNESNLEWNLNEVPNDFSIRYSGINFHSWKGLP